MLLRGVTGGLRSDKVWHDFSLSLVRTCRTSSSAVFRGELEVSNEFWTDFTGDFAFNEFLKAPACQFPDEERMWHPACQVLDEERMWQSLCLGTVGFSLCRVVMWQSLVLAMWVFADVTSRAQVP